MTTTGFSSWLLLCCVTLNKYYFIQDDSFSTLCSTISSPQDSLNGMWIDVICYKPHTLSLKPFKLFFQQLHWFLKLWIYFIKTSITFCIHNVTWHETLNLLHVSSCEMFTFCDNYTNQNKKHKLSRVCTCSTDWKSTLSVMILHCNSVSV